MALKVDIDISRKFIVSADIDSVYALLSDVPASAAHFPKLAKLTKLADNTYRWDMEKVNLGTQSAQTSYACVYSANDQEKTISWTPIKGEGNAIVSGMWKLNQSTLSQTTELSFSTKAQLNLPLPGLLKLAISPIVKLEFSSMVDTYHKNIERYFAQT